MAEPKYNLPVGTRFLDSRGDVWVVTADHYSTGRRGSIKDDKFIAKHESGRAWQETALFTKGRGKFGDRTIVCTDPATIAKHLADKDAARTAKAKQEQAEREADERAQREHEATPLHQLADRIASAKVNWDYCAGFELLGMDLLRLVEKRLIKLGKLKAK